MGYSPQCHKESDTTEVTEHAHMRANIRVYVCAYILIIIPEAERSENYKLPSPHFPQFSEKSIRVQGIPSQILKLRN